MHHNGRVLGVIGGSGFYTFFESDTRTIDVDTPYGRPSAPVTVGTVAEHEVAFLPRHGPSHEFSAHTVPYRANMWALRKLGVRRVFAPCAVGSLIPDNGPGTVVVPDQLVDRTSGRADTYFDSGGIHVDFADPYCPTLRAAATGLPGVVDGGTMVVIQGPRFSTRAESRWFASAGFSLVNMTGYPEAVLARELELCYAAIALVTDLDAGVRAGEGVTAVEVFAQFERNIGPFKRLVREAIGRVAADNACTHCQPHTGVTLPVQLP
jgi:5'-methylthioadenosine phosphorylase